VPQAYDYDSLVDRWYAVYDTHYRSHSIVPESEFEVQKYVSAWDEETGTGAELLIAGGGATTGGALGLEDLRRLAVEGMSVASGKGTGGEGEYMSLPLDGRVDLMRHLEEEEEEEEEEAVLLDETQLRTPVSGPKELAPSSPPRMMTLPTPGPEELPPTPYLRGHSLPPTPVPGWRQQEQPSPSPAGPQQKHDPPVTFQQQQQHRQERPRIPSPPLLSWNPSIEPPPNVTPTPHAFPSDTYFPNVWDQSHESTHLDDTYRLPHSGKPGPDSQAFFEVPPPSEIPEELLRQGHYRNVTGPHSDHSTATPDKAKVKSVFPWEEKPRHLPGRIFPGSESPPPGMIFKEIQKIEVTPPEEVTTPEKQAGGRVYATPSPLNIGFPPNLTYANAWDTVPQITKYANRLVKPAPWALPSPGLGTPSVESPHHRKKSWDDRAEVSSRDGDDEGDDEDESDENEAAPVGMRRWDDSVDDTKPLKTRSRSGSVNESISASRALKGKYRMQGVQTIRRVKRDVGVQVPDSEDEKKSSPRQTKSSMGLDESLPVVAQTTTLSPDQMTQSFRPTSSFPAAHPASGLRSPREVTSPQGNSPLHSPPRPGPILKVLGPPPQLIERQSSTETNVSTTSPASSIGPISPTDSPITSPLRKAVRVWDPARGVELFKRGSEEVLAKFLKMGSWDSEPTAQQHHA
jgi:glycogenin glucosyltransferase